MKKLILLFIVLSTNLVSQNIWEERLNLRGTPEESVIKNLEVVDSNTIYFTSTKGLPNYLYKSTNQGISWELVNDLYKYDAHGINDIEVIDSEIYLAFGKGVILKSTNSGESFEKFEVSYKNSIEDIFMLDNNIGFVNMPLYKFYTTDSWSSNNESSFPFLFNMFHPKKFKNNIYSVILKINDDLVTTDGYRFAKLNTISNKIEINDFTHFGISDLEIINDSIFYLCGYKNNIKGGSCHDAVFKSTDAGKTWKPILDLYTNRNKFNLPPYGLQDIAFKNDSVGISVGQFGKILYTYDGGNSWYYENNLPKIIDSLSPPTMRVTYAGDRAIIADFTGAIHILKEDNLFPKTEDTLTISGRILSNDSLAITHIPVSLDKFRITMTDEDGYYKFTKVSPGSHTITCLNKYIDSGPNEEYHFEPYLYSPTHEIDLINSANDVDFEALYSTFTNWIYGYVYLDGEPLEGIEICLDSIENGKKYTLISDFDGYYKFDSIPYGTYQIYAKSDIYKIEPEVYEFFFHFNIGFYDFTASPINSVQKDFNFKINDEVLITRDNVGLKYIIFSLDGKLVSNGLLPKELNLNQPTNGTYILNITKGDKVVYTYKYQVVN